jgi:hypothetical protein
MNVSFRTIGKLGFLLVIIGFFMPIACEMDGFQLAKTFKQMDSAESAMLLYGLFSLAIVGLILGILLLMKKNMPVVIDWLILIACIACGIAVYLGTLNDDAIELESGAYMIIIGWVVVLISQIIPSNKKS